MVMQSAKDGVGMDISSSLNWARERLRPYLASDAFAINRRHRRLESAQVRFAQYDELVETLPSDRPF
jgi:hypothetical protein